MVLAAIFFSAQKIFAAWAYDSEPPAISFPTPKACNTKDEWDDAQYFKIQASDSPAGVQSITIKLTKNGSFFKEWPTENTPPGSNNWVKLVPSAEMEIGDYILEITGLDNAGNSASYTYNFAYKIECPSDQWIQTKVGDVHSNDNIDTRGGP